MKPAVLRPRAKQDLSDGAVYYTIDGGERLGQAFLDAAVAALESIQRMPGIGSPSLAMQSNIPGLRAWGVKGFPVRWFYFERDSSLDVVRLLGDRQDAGAILDAEPPPA